ncbi:hypothetical protein [Glycomyces sp. NPDC021274]|uniref:hypothetical protein n=1 Tax=Glycomyces sp. NPDC021274 TaxID=3155120 RepID=UPI0033DD954E
MERTPSKKKLPPATNARPKERRHTGVAGDPQSMAIAGALNDAESGKPSVTTDEERAQRKRAMDHPIYTMLRRVARDNYIPKKDEIEALNLPPKYKSELAYAIRHVARWREQPPEVEERKTKTGKVINAGYRSPASLAHEKAAELATSLVGSLPADHETRLEVKTRHAAEDAQAKRQSDDSEAVADRVWRGEH